MIAGLIGLILLAAAFWQTGLPDGLELVRLGANDILLEFIDNLGGLDGSRPLELVGLIRKIPYAQRVLG